MNECHRLLQNLGVSDEDLDRMVDAALPSSLGAKLTGAGGGGCMIALTTEPRRTAEAIELAGGEQWSHNSVHPVSELKRVIAGHFSIFAL